MKRVKSARQAQRFLSAHDQISNLFHLRRDHVTARAYRAARARAFEMWTDLSGGCCRGLNPACVRKSPGKEDGCNLKPFEVVQRVRLPPGKGAAHQPEASLAWAAVTPLVKRRPQIPKPGVEPRD
jgi:hypothetical protein